VLLKQTASGWTCGGLFNHLWSVDDDDVHRDVSTTLVQLFVSRRVGPGRTLSASAESTYDWEGEQWTVPINVSYGPPIRIGRQLVNVQGGGERQRGSACARTDRFVSLVFATSRMVALMEIAATRLMRPLLEEGQHSVGVEVSIKHTAATPVGGNARAVATYLGPAGKLHRFRVQAFDDAGSLGEDEHTRAIVSTERLLAGATKRTHSR
jgi:predicted thioesterase